MRTRILLVLLLAAAALAGCVQTDGADREPPVLTYLTDGSSYKGPSQTVAGWTEIRLINQGSGVQQAALYRLQDGDSAQDFAAAVLDGGAGGVPAGGVAGVMPGEASSAVVLLEEGTYIITSHTPLGGKQPVRELRVLARDGPAPLRPASGMDVRMTDFAFEAPVATVGGSHTFRVHNDGQHPHEAVLVRLAPGANAADFLAAFAPVASLGPPPGAVVGGLAPIAAGTHGYFTADLEPGMYAWVCFIPDPATKLPHSTLGMVKEFQVV